MGVIGFKARNVINELKVNSPTQSTFTCSKLTIKTLEQAVKYVQS